MTPRALIYGTIALDTLYTPHGTATRTIGGSAPYAALAARLVSPDFDMLGVVGDDYPAEFTAALEGAGVSLSRVERRAGRTFAWTGRYERDMNLRETLETIEGVQENWHPQLPEDLRHHALACMCNVTPPHQYHILSQCTSVFSMADYMERWIRREPEYTLRLIRTADMSLMNDSEACAWAGTDEPLRAGQALLDAGARYAVIKHGSAGCTLFHRTSDGLSRLFRCPAWPLPHAVDPTGAGDSFMGALSAALLPQLGNGTPPWEALTHAIAVATVIAGITCEQFGPAALLAATPSLVAQRLADFRRMTAWA